MGSFDPNQKEAYQTALQALHNGYRYIDTAAGYNTEEAVGRAVRDSGVPREEIVVQTKLSPACNGEGKVKGAFEKSLKQLGTASIVSPRFFKCA